MSDKAMLLYYDQKISMARHYKKYIKLITYKIKKFLLERK